MNDFDPTREQDQTPDLARLLPCLRAHLPDILCRRPVLLAYLYGSVAEGHPSRKRYFDFAPVAEMMRRSFLGRLRREGLLRGMR